MNNRGWIQISKSYTAPFQIKEEIVYFFKRLLVDSLMFFPLIVFVCFIFVRNKLVNQNNLKMLFGTHPITTFNIFKHMLETEYETTLFVFDDYSKGNFHEGITLKDILPKYFRVKNPYFFGSYFAFFWAIKNFHIFHLYFDAGFLERTFWWRLEPLIYQLLRKKVVLYPYGTDAMTLLNNTNLSQKIGHMYFSDKYFNMDFKRFKRNYWWSKYVTLVVGFAPYIKFLPRLDVLIWHGQVALNYQDIKVNLFDKNTKKIKILHFANHKIRKGSYLIEKVLSEVCSTHKHVSFECLEGVSRDEALRKLDECDIFVDSLIDGFFQFSSLDAMIRGKVSLSFYDEEINSVFKQLNPEYYVRFLEEFPGINININNFKEKLLALIEEPDDISSLSLRSEATAKKMIEENIENYKTLINELVAS